MAPVSGNAIMPEILASTKGLPYRSWVEVSRGQIAANFRSIRNVVGPGVEIMPVVKADAYRHGAIEVSRTLEEQGARWLAVSNTGEGVALRDAGIQTRILVMADFLPFTREAMLAYGLTPVLHSLEEIAELDQLAKQRGSRLRYHLKLDSGMGRLGVRDEAVRIANAIDASANLELEGLMTHFASAGNYQARQTEEQIACFDRVIDVLAAAGIRPAIVHMSSTIPIAYGRRPAWRSMVRPGHSIYGYVSPARGHAPAKLLDVKPALSWRATIL
jgi:alanine racemase